MTRRIKRAGAGRNNTTFRPATKRERLKFWMQHDYLVRLARLVRFLEEMPPGYSSLHGKIWVDKMRSYYGARLDVQIERMPDDVKNQARVFLERIGR